MLDESLVREISEAHSEPDWMLRLRLRALRLFYELPEPTWIRGVDGLDAGHFTFSSESGIRVDSWEDLPEDVRRVYERLHIPDRERALLAGIATTVDTETLYSRLAENLAEKGVILEPMGDAIQKYPSLVRRHFSRIFPMAEHRYSALHYVLWSGGVFIYVPPGVKLDIPVEAFLYISGGMVGQFEHSIIIADRGAKLHFIEGCSAPTFRKPSFHNGAVEVYAGEGSRVKFITVQNWSKNVINFGNKRAIAEAGAVVEWAEGSIGSRTSVVYPSVVLRGAGARANIHIFSLSHGPFVKDGGAKVFHVAPNTKSLVVSKGIAGGRGVNIYRGLVRIVKGAENAEAHTSCDSLILDGQSEVSTYPHAQIEEPTAVFSHEATTLRFSEDLLFYLQSRGVDEEQAKGLAVLGFVQDVLKNLPLEYAAVLREVLNADFSGGVG